MGFLRHSLTLYSTASLLCGLLLCCASVTAAQSVEGALTTQPGVTVSSQVSASVNEAVNEAPGSAAGPSGPAMGLNSRIAAGVQSGEARVQMLVTPAGSSLSMISIRVPGTSTTPSVFARASATPKRPHGHGGEGPYSGSGSFPDSTKGTAGISPLDTGTSSSLEWTPGFGFEFPDFQATQFLNPALNGSRNVLNSTLKSSGPATHPSLSSHPPTEVIPRSALKTHLKQSDLHKSIDQQVGLLGAQ